MYISLVVMFMTHGFSPSDAHSSQNQPDNFHAILYSKPKLGKYLKGKCYSEHYRQLSFNLLVKLFSIPKLLSKV